MKLLQGSSLGHDGSSSNQSESSSGLTGVHWTWGWEGLTGHQQVETGCRATLFGACAHIHAHTHTHAQSQCGPLSPSAVSKMQKRRPSPPRPVIGRGQSVVLAAVCWCLKDSRPSWSRTLAPLRLLGISGSSFAIHFNLKVATVQI